MQNCNGVHSLVFPGESLCMIIWIDADACPVKVKEIIFKAGLRLKVKIILVANKRMGIPASNLIQLVVVDQGFDAADAYIVTHSSSSDLAITSDIPLANELVDKGVSTLNSRGMLYTAENIKEVLVMRNMMQEFREGGMIRGGPAPFGNKDIEKFANAFDRELVRLLKREQMELKKKSVSS